MGEGIAKQAHLPVVQIAQVLGVKLPANFRVPGESARAGARDIDQNAIERAFERKRLLSVQDVRLDISNAGAFESLPHGARTMLVQIRGDDMALRSNRSRQEQGLATRSRA
jgi:hypothetical protein